MLARSIFYKSSQTYGTENQKRQLFRDGQCTAKVDLSLDNFVLVLYLTNKCIKKIPSARLLEQLAVSASLAVKAKNGANSSLLVTFSSLKKQRPRAHEGERMGKKVALILAIAGILNG